MSTKVMPRGAYPHTKRVGEFIFVSGTSSRRKDNSIAGVDIIDDMGTKHLNIETQTREVLATPCLATILEPLTFKSLRQSFANNFLKDKLGLVKR